MLKFHKGVGFVDAAVKKTLSHEPIEIWGDGTVIRVVDSIDSIKSSFQVFIIKKISRYIFNSFNGMVCVVEIKRCELTIMDRLNCVLKVL